MSSVADADAPAISPHWLVVVLIFLSFPPAAAQTVQIPTQTVFAPGRDTVNSIQVTSILSQDTTISMEEPNLAQDIAAPVNEICGVALVPTAQDLDGSLSNAYAGYAREDISSLRYGVSIGMVSAISASIVVDSYYAWWKDANSPFSFYTEGWLTGPHLGIDKFGHFFGTYATSKIIRNMLLWGGHSPGASLWWAAGIAAFHSLQIEIGDAFSPFGFDYQDMLSGFFGVGYMILQSEVPFLQNFDFKVSYWSKAGLTSPANFFSDYDAMTVWLTGNVHRLLPESLDSYWPEFLQLAVGYGVGWGESRREFVIGLDFNIQAFSACNDNVLLAQRIVDLIHYPAPALKLTGGKGPLWYGAHLK